MATDIKVMDRKVGDTNLLAAAGITIHAATSRIPTILTEITMVTAIKDVNNVL